MDRNRAFALVVFCSTLPVFALADQSTTMIRPSPRVDAVPVCTLGHLCQVKGNSNTDQGGSDCVRWCYCDDACGFFGDCCYDYEDGSSQLPGPRRRSASKMAKLTPDPGDCMSSSDGGSLDGGDGQLRRDCNVSDDGYDGESGVDSEFDGLAEYLTTTGTPRSHFPCTYVGQPVSEPPYRYGFWLNSFCPANASVNSRRLCEDPPGDDVILKTPVSGARGVAYKNVYCAICNGEDLSRLDAWAVDVYCNSLNQSAAILDAPRQRGANYTFDFQDLDAACRLVFSSRKGVGVRYCFPDVVADCGSHDGSTGLCEACDSYAAVAIEPERFPPGPRRVFRNPHCALSHGVRITSGAITNSCALVCGSGSFVTPMIPSLSILINFGTGTAQVDDLVLPSRCPADFVFDPFTDRCRILSCADGYRLEGGQCIAQEPPDTEEESNVTATVEFLVEVNIDGTVNCSSAGEVGLCMAKPLLQILDGLSVQRFTLGGIVPKCRLSDSNTTSFEMTMTRENAQLDINILEKELDIVLLNGSRGGFGECLSFNNDTNLRSIVFVRCHSATCGIRETAKCGNVVGNITEIFPLQSNVSDGFVRVDNTWYSAEQTVYSVIYGWQPGNESFDKLGMRVRVCDGEELSCAHVALNASLFRPIGGPEGSSLEYLPTGYILAPGNFSILRNGSVMVCSFFDNGTVQGTRDDLAKLLISLIGLTLSMIATAVIFVTYLAFRSLRNHMRCPMLNLTASLILANLMFLLSKISTANDVACTAVAFLGHVFWLSVSTWSNIIAVGMYGAFSVSAMSLRDQRVTRRKLVYFYLYAYGAPCCISIPCLVLELTYKSRDVPLFRYRSGDVCFINSSDQMLYAFVVPLLACVLVNLVLFSLTVRGIRITKMKAQMVKGNTPVMRQAMEELPIYLKISSLMGFCWLVGFLATVTKSTVLEYIYLVSNSCQGLLIFLCFANGRVRALWRAKLRALFRACCSGGVAEPKREAPVVATVSERCGTGASGDNHAGDGSASVRTEETAL
ncbi:uncharacterized protein LOC119730636 [Patiria miniata]|uniref:G-protein coupled receptors family 2 profile 2 domain-containing protein n=1 Tax=Patiria miniata TaxID=46514 RepID=A0A914A6R2_PATMI|nr:uncharacterized protein LOC119730636 [Patiria miniata]